MSKSSRFSNRENERFQVSPERVVFDSRSVAVTAVVIAYDESQQTFYALAGERGPSVDHSGLWCLVCGYLDWDERLDEAVRREVFEEAGIDLRALEASGDAIVSPHPVYLQSDPASHRQNVTARFSVELSRRVPVSPTNAEPGEVMALRWIEVTSPAIAELTWAFRHDSILEDLAAWYRDERAKGQLDEKSTRRFYRSHLERRYPFV